MQCTESMRHSERTPHFGPSVETSRATLKSRRRFRSLAIAAIVWLTFTISLAGWWLYFGLTQLAALESAAPNLLIEIDKHQRMLMFEGGFLISCLVIGGVTLLILAWQQMLQARRLEDFFLTVSHEIKTPLAGIQLQAEMLKEELVGNAEDLKDEIATLKPEGSAQKAKVKSVDLYLGGYVDKIIESVNRLSLQFENSLFMAALSSGDALSGEDKGTAWMSRLRALVKGNPPSSLLIEDISLNEELELLSTSFPSLRLLVEGSQSVRVDRRVLRAILNNLLQNSVFHGKAEHVSFRCFEAPLEHMIKILVVDDGVGFKGNIRDLARPFARMTRSSGTGLGLFLVKRLIKLSGGEFRIIDSSLEGTKGERGGFSVEISLPTGANSQI